MDPDPNPNQFHYGSFFISSRSVDTVMGLTPTFLAFCDVAGYRSQVTGCKSQVSGYNKKAHRS